jgi:DNA-directed RNA polymerase I subunit RPA49
MEKYFKETGATIKGMTDGQREKQHLTKEESTQHKMAKLVLPLQFPKERQIVPKRRA